MLLLVAATLPESEGLRQKLQLQKKADAQLDIWRDANGDICLLHTGLGMTNTAYALGRYFALYKVDVAINFGIAGAHDAELPLCSVVEVVSDCFAELGADSPSGTLFLDDMGFPLLEVNGKAYFNELYNPQPLSNVYPSVSGLTVNRVSGSVTEINRRYEEWPRQIETMEGAAFFQACLWNETPFYALRAISNYVEARNRQNWKLKAAIEKLQEAILVLVEELK